MREPVHVTLWVDGANVTSSVVFVHGSTCWGTDPRFGFLAQRLLAASFRLVVMDRRGYGQSPDIEHSDYAVDAEDIVGLLGDGAHLVGHSYGGVAAMLAAATVPDRVQSLVLIEPGCYQAARDHPVVAEALRRNRATLAQIPQQISDAQYLQQVTAAIGMTALEPTPERLRAARGGRHERPCWEAPIPVQALAAASYPKMVISGTWENAPATYRRLGGEPLMACAALTAQRIGARLIKIKAASHFPHVEQPGQTNQALLSAIAAQRQADA